MLLAVDKSDLATRILAGDRRALARAISLVEQGGAQAKVLMAEIYPHTGKAKSFGITGPPGAGKSTLVALLARTLRAQGFTVGIIAVDPSSPFTGGAILGDRIRMQALGGDSGVFIRSMASRGRTGGLARASGDALALLDAAGYQRIIIETVGAGQSEVEIASLADSTIVVDVPGLGDDVQSIKAGMLEIADLFVVNKADRDGAEALVRRLRSMIELGGERYQAWKPTVLKAVASEAQGAEAIIEALEAHWNYLASSSDGEQQAAHRAERELQEVLAEMLFERLQSQDKQAWQQAIAALASRQQDPYSLAEELLRRL
jgi:LAO/AO transport system kinase